MILNGWDCQFTQENPILSPGKNMTLSNNEIKEIYKKYNSAKIIVIHLDGVNHATVSRKEFIEYCKYQWLNNVIIPLNWETVTL